jgi:hypothetical protein
VIDGSTNEVVCGVSTGKGAYAIDCDAQLNKVYVADIEDGTVSVIADTVLAGLRDGARDEVRLPTIVFGVLRLEDQRQETGERTELLDVSGRKVLDLHAGANDVSHLAPGVYFVRQLPAVSRKPSAVGVRKVVLTK